MTTEDKFNVVVNHAFGGWHHVEKRQPSGTGVRFNVFGTFATFDYAQLTRLVLAAHAVRVRVEVGQSGPRMLRVSLHVREHKPTCFAAHHPSLDDLIADAEKLKAEIASSEKDSGSDEPRAEVPEEDVPPSNKDALELAFHAGLDIVKGETQVGPSRFQRKLICTYNFALDLMELMSTRGVLGPMDPATGRRAVLG
jgi:hypothetical protein